MHKGLETRLEREKSGSYLRFQHAAFDKESGPFAKEGSLLDHGR